MNLAGVEHAVLAAVAVLVAVLLLVATVIAVAAVGLLKDELKGWISVATRSIARRRAASMEDPDDAEAYIADVEGEIRGGAYRPFWVLGDAVAGYASARLRELRTRPRAAATKGERAPKYVHAISVAAVLSLVPWIPYFAGAPDWALTATTLLAAVASVLIILAVYMEHKRYSAFRRRRERE